MLKCTCDEYQCPCHDKLNLAIIALHVIASESTAPSEKAGLALKALEDLRSMKSE